MLATPLLRSKELPNLQYTSTPDRFDDTWETPLATLLGLGRAAGANFVEFFLERVNFISCLAEDNSITSITPRLTTGAGVRVFRGQTDCYVSTNDLSFNGLKAALEKGLSILGLQLPAPGAFIPEINLEPLRDYGTLRGKESWLEQCSSMREMGDVLLSASDVLQHKANHIQSRRISYFRDWQEVLVASSDGTFARDIRLTQTIGSMLLCADGANRASISRRSASPSNAGAS